MSVKAAHTLAKLRELPVSAQRLSEIAPRRLTQRLRSSLRGEEGFTMIAVMVTLLIASVLVAAALDAAQGDYGLVRNDLDQKEAYLAAKAGISDYQFHLNQDPNYWAGCPSPQNVALPGGSGATYSLNPLPVQAPCSTSNPVGSMVVQDASSPAYETFRIQSTGQSADKAVSRTIVASFKRQSFLDFVYYTVYETLDPAAYQSASDRAAAATQCDQFWRDGRPAATNPPNYCVQIFWQNGDAVNGPMHTEDELAICGNASSGPVFGRAGKNDSIQIGGSKAPNTTGHSTQGNAGCYDNPTFNTQSGTPQVPAPSIQPPPTNAQLKQIAQPAYQFTGATHITLNNGGTMTVTNANLNGGAATSMSFPSNQVVYVSSSSCSTSYTPFNVTYPGPAGCGTVTVDGNYNSSLTIASDNDVVIDGNLIGSNNALLGLIAQNYVRIYHPCSGGVNQSGSMSNPTIDAAMLALTGSFIVDNYNCGAQLGNLNVNGSISQVYRGPVSIIGSSGYVKNYNYDDNLKAEEPPHFLEPVQVAWHVIRETECSSPSAC